MFKDRITKIQQTLAKRDLDAILISSVSNITYFTGFSNFSDKEKEAYLIIAKDEQHIITDGRYSEAVKREISHFQLFERSEQNPTEKLFKSLKKKIEVLGIEEDELTITEYKLLAKHFKKMKHVDIKKHRVIKTPEEISKIAQAAKLGDQAFKYIFKKMNYPAAELRGIVSRKFLSHHIVTAQQAARYYVTIKPGISEKQLAFELEFFVKEHGAELSFPSIVAFGGNSAIPHHQTGQTVLEQKEGQFILLDFGVRLENYCSDMTRTVFFGKPSEKQKKIYQTVLEAQQKAIDFVNSSVKSGRKIMAAEVDKVVRDCIISKGYPTIPHSSGHGIGLEVHESPSISPKSKDYLKEGMVFSLEPGIYLPDFGGVRIEDLYTIKNGELKQITNSPKELLIV